METLVDIQKRLSVLKSFEQEFSAAALKEKQDSDKIFIEFRAQLAKIKEQIALIKKETAAIQENFKDSVKELRKTVSNSDIDVLQRKMQKYSKENLLPVSEFSKMVEKEF